MSVSGIEVSPLRANDEIVVGSLFRGQGMKFAGFTLNYDRGTGFQRLLALQAPRFETYLAKEDSQLRSLISISSGPRWYNEAVREVAFVSDFRIDHSPKARAVWRDLLDQVVRDFSIAQRENRPELLFALVLKDNKAALRSFTESPRTTQFQMREVGSVRMINIFARLGRAPSIAGLHVAPFAEADRNELIEFLKAREKKRQLGYVFGQSDFDEATFRHESWSFRWRDFLILRQAGKIVGCCLPWAADSSVKVMSFTKAPRILEFVLKQMNRLGGRAPLRGEPIKTLYLTHLNLAPDVEADDAISQFLNFIYVSKLHRDYQMVSFPDWWQLKAGAKSLKRTLHQKMTSEFIRSRFQVIL